MPNVTLLVRTGPREDSWCLALQLTLSPACWRLPLDNACRALSTPASARHLSLANTACDNPELGCPLFLGCPIRCRKRCEHGTLLIHSFVPMSPKPRLVEALTGQTDKMKGINR